MFLQVLTILQKSACRINSFASHTRDSVSRDDSKVHKTTEALALDVSILMVGDGVGIVKKLPARNFFFASCLLSHCCVVSQPGFALCVYCHLTRYTLPE